MALAGKVVIWRKGYGMKEDLTLKGLRRSALGKDIADALAFWESHEAERRHWKRYFAVRTRQALSRCGPKVAIQRYLKRPPTPGTLALIEMNRPDLTWEAIAMRNPRQFHLNDIERARTRLASFGVKRLPKARQ
jgi:hypothetical protein